MDLMRDPMVNYYVKQQVQDRYDAGYRSDDDMAREQHHYPDGVDTRDLEQDRTPFRPRKDIFKYLE